MNNRLLGVAANIAAVIGVLICAVAGIGRMLGFYHLASFQTLTLFIGGMSLMMFAALVKLYRVEVMLSDKS